jgi:hypothetical protein
LSDVSTGSVDYLNGCMPGPERLNPTEDAHQIDAALRAVAFILLLWARNDDEYRRNGHHRPLAAIEFDKLANLVLRLWEYLHANHSTVVRFAPFFQELPGTHGPGRAVTDGKSRPIFFPELVYELQRLGVATYFQCELPPDGDLGPSDPRTEFFPDASAIDPNDLISPFPQGEQRALREIAGAIRLLSAAQIRELGTHCSQKATLQNIHREYRWILEKRLIDDIIVGIRGDGPSVGVTSSFLIFADEAARKSGRNRDLYSSGRETMISACDYDAIRQAVQTVQHEASLIWDHRMQQEAERAGRVLRLAQYCHAFALARARKSTRDFAALAEAANALLADEIRASTNVQSDDRVLIAALEHLANELRQHV